MYPLSPRVLPTPHRVRKLSLKSLNGHWASGWLPGWGSPHTPTAWPLPQDGYRPGDRHLQAHLALASASSLRTLTFPTRPASGQGLRLGTKASGDKRASVFSARGALRSGPCRVLPWAQASDVLLCLAYISAPLAASQEHDLKRTAFHLPAARPAPHQSFQQP